MITYIPPPDQILLNGEHLYNLIGTDGVSAWYQEPYSGVTVQSYTLPGGGNVGPVASSNSWYWWLNPPPGRPTVLVPDHPVTPTPTAQLPEPGTGLLLTGALVAALVARRFGR
jgi:hypothetical protein